MSPVNCCHKGKSSSDGTEDSPYYIFVSCSVASEPATDEGGGDATKKASKSKTTRLGRFSKSRSAKSRKDTKSKRSIVRVKIVPVKMEDMKDVVNKLRRTFENGKTKNVDFRLAQLRKLAEMLEENRQSWKDALNADMGRCDFEGELCEIVPVVAEATTTHNELRDWVKPEKAKTGTLNAMDQAVVQRDPLGLCLIISAWNYPLQYTLSPLIGAIAAGNVAVIKASSKCPRTTDLMTRLFPKYLDSSAYVVIGGDADVGAQLLRHFSFDFVFFTGKTSTGKEVMKAAAEKLTPVSLHLGGKNPVYVDDHCDVDKVARCVLWGKMMNAGQNCAAPDYVLCRREVLTKLVDAMKKAVKTFYGEDPRKSPHFGRLVDKEEWKRVAEMIVGDKVVIGGTKDEESLYIAPTVMTNVTPSDAVMSSEIFGPVLPILSVASIEEALNFIGARPKALAVYAFSSKNDVISQFQESTTSGGFCGNDVLSHLSLSTLPASGVGASGLGPPYHGFFSFDAFSHRKSVLIKKMALEGTLAPRYPPYTEGHLNLAKNALKKKFKGVSNSVSKKKGEGGDSD